MTRYKMVGRDVDCGFPTQHRTWVVANQPDFTGEFYSGLKAGDNPFVNVSAYTILDDNVVADFNLPNALDWSTTKSVLPEAIYNSQAAIVDGYVYLFGGEKTTKIFRAPLARPNEWVDTGATLPFQLGSSQLAVINQYIYLFGGDNGNPVDTIFTAPISDPLSWTNQGSLLPKAIANSQLSIIDGYVYLFGGRDGSGATDSILIAPANDPLNWQTSVNILPNALYGSQLAIVDGYAYLLGGILAGDIKANRIYSAHLNAPTIWNWVEVLPRIVAYGQYVAVGDKGYLITVADTTDGHSMTRILRCHLSNPTSWVDTLHFIPGVVTQSQLVVINDRLFLLGGNGSSVIFADNPLLKYDFNNLTVIDYGLVTRTMFNAAAPLDLFAVLGYAPWRTNY